ncbi:hypothetical protein BDZ45DRAFT_805694 [Acephala macrosclerotiorum]|nr:hypothetical protein BDZ45DRAFT_805694 [Acephala macrosclerotiorum]
MAEAFALLGALSAILQIADSSRMVANLLRRVAREAGSATDDIQSFASILSSFQSIVAMAFVTVEKHCSKGNNSQAVRTLEDKKVLEMLTIQSKYIEKRLEGIGKKLEQLDESKLNWWKKAVWVLYRKPELLELSPQMDCMKSNLLVVIAVLQLDSSSQEQRSEYATKKENYLQTMLQDAISEIRAISRTNTIASLSEARLTAVSEGRNKLIEIATPLVDDSILAGYSLTSSSLSKGYDGYRAQKPRRKHRPSDSFGSVGPLPTNGSQHAELKTRTKNTQHVSHSTDSMRHMIQDRHPQSKRSNQTKTETVSPSITKSVEHVRQVELDDAVASSSHVNPKNDENLAAVCRTKNVLKLNSLDKTVSDNGYIETPKGRIPTKLYYEEYSGQNYISSYFAGQLGLEIELLRAGDEEVWIEREDGGTEKCFGKVKLKWNRASASVGNSVRIPIESQFFVYDDLGENRKILILGDSFPGKKRYYWSNGAIYAKLPPNR